jgi:hypothetical protein
MKTIYTVIVMMVLGCGSVNDPTKKDATDTNKDAATAAVVTPSPTSSIVQEGSYFKVSGYVSPINITVNSVTYRNSEDFYTKELIKLTNEAKTSYPGYTLSFEGNLGLSNFITGMTVFLVSTGDQGVASQTTVDGMGKFTFLIDGPIDTNAAYTLAGAKRIGMTLNPPKGSKDEPISWCYNLEAETNIALKNNPIILRTFTTLVTQYQCNDSNNDMSLPTNDAAQEEAIRQEQIAHDEEVNNPSPTPSPSPTPTSTPSPSPTPSN